MSVSPGYTTRTTSRSTRCTSSTWWPTAWAATATARWRRRSRSMRSASSSTRAADKDTTWPFGMDNRLARHTNLLRMAVRIAHDHVLRAISKDGSLYGMGTTVVGFLLAEQHRRRGARGRQPGLPPAQWTPRPAYSGPYLGQRAGGGRLPLEGAGALAPAQERGHPRPGRRERRRGRRARAGGQGGRPLSTLLGRPDRNAPGQRHPRTPLIRPRPPRDLPQPGQRLECPRWDRQCDGGPAQDRGGRRRGHAGRARL